MRGFSLFRFFFFPFSVPSLSMPSFVPLCPMSSFSPVLFLSSPCSLCPSHSFSFPSPFFLFPFPARRYSLSFFSLSFLCPRPVLSILFSPRLSPVLPVLFSPRLSPVLPVLFSPHLSPVPPGSFSPSSLSPSSVVFLPPVDTLCPSSPRLSSLFPLSSPLRLFLSAFPNVGKQRLHHHMATLRTPQRRHMGTTLPTVYAENGSAQRNGGSFANCLR